MSIQYLKTFKIAALAFAISLSSLPSQGMAHDRGHHSYPGFYINWHHFIKPYRKYKRHHHHNHRHHYPQRITHSHDGYKKKYGKKYKKNKIVRKHLRRD